MNLKLHLARAQTRREFFKHSGVGLGALALTTLLQRDGFAVFDRIVTESVCCKGGSGRCHKLSLHLRLQIWRHIPS
jgi:hypothetical protein